MLNSQENITCKEISKDELVDDNSEKASISEEAEEKVTFCSE